MKLSRIAYRNIGRNKRRSILSGIAIGVAAMAIVILFSLLNGMQADLATNLQDFYSGMVRIRHAEYDENELLSPLHLRVEDADERVEELEAMPEVSAVSPRISFPASIYENGETYSARGMGVDMVREVDYARLDGYLIDGTLPAPGAREVVLGYVLADRLGVGVGDQLTILTLTMRRSSNAMTFEVAGTVRLPVEGLNTQLVMAPIDTVRELVRMEDAASEILVKLDNERDAPAVAEALRASWDGGLRIVTWDEIPSSYAFIQWARNIYNGIAAFFFVLGSTVIITTTMIVIFERMREIGTIAAMGMTGNEIVRLFFLESLFIALIAAAVGVAVGSGFSLLLGEMGIDLGESLEGIDIELGADIYPQWNPVTAAIVYVYSVAITALATYFPSRRAAKIEPVEALHTV